MTQSIPMQRFLQALLGDRKMAAPAAEVGRAVRAARSLRRTDEGAYKRIQWTPGRSGGGRGPTEVERPQARKTESVGETRGFWLLLLAAPIGGGPSPGGRKMIADRHDRRAIVIRQKAGTHPKFSEGRQPAGPESGLSGRGVQGVGAGPRRTPGNRMDLRRMETGRTG